RAADYLDSRQKEWFAWPRAKVEGGVCVSCHTGVTYLLARPALRVALGESQPTAYEKGLLEGIHAQADAEGNRQGAEAVFATLFFALQNANSKILSVDAKRAFERLWSLQIREGKDRGTWKDRKSTRLNSSHVAISYAVFCLKKKRKYKT